MTRSMLVPLWLICSCASAAIPPAAVEHAAAEAAIGAVLDDWHAAASAADEERYFGHFAPEGVFLGTDATERWDVAAFRDYAHPHFAAGEAWSFRAARRAIMVGEGGQIAWFDEDLDTVNLGPARGSGVMVLVAGRWQIAHYNLTITVPNERFRQVREVLRQPAPAEPSGSR